MNIILKETWKKNQVKPGIFNTKTVWEFSVRCKQKAQKHENFNWMKRNEDILKKKENKGSLVVVAKKSRCRIKIHWHEVDLAASTFSTKITFPFEL